MMYPGKYGDMCGISPWLSISWVRMLASGKSAVVFHPSVLMCLGVYRPNTWIQCFVWFPV